MTAAEPPRASHYSEGKPGVDQIPPEVLMELGKVFQYGATKYGRDNWKLGTDWHEFYGSLLRHSFRWWMGEDIDPETGVHHLAHAMWNAGALLYYQNRSIGLDDRDHSAKLEKCCGGCIMGDEQAEEVFGAPQLPFEWGLSTETGNPVPVFHENGRAA